MSAATAMLALFGALTQPAAQRQATRVGVLNTGELVLVDATGAAHVVSEPTTRLIREQLIHADFADSEIVLFPPGEEAGKP